MNPKRDKYRDWIGHDRESLHDFQDLVRQGIGKRTLGMDRIQRLDPRVTNTRVGLNQNTDPGLKSLDHVRRLKDLTRWTWAKITRRGLNQKTWIKESQILA